MFNVKLNDRKQLVRWLASAQRFILLFGLISFGFWVHFSVTKIIRQQLTQQNKRIAEQMGRLLTELTPSQVAYGDSNWEKLQSFVEQAKLPNDGYLCIADIGDGTLLCHPKLRDAPQMRGISLMNLELGQDGKSTQVFKSLSHFPRNTRDEKMVSGTSGSGFTTEVITAASLPSVNGVYSFINPKQRREKRFGES
jgi:hypothetical protein